MIMKSRFASAIIIAILLTVISVMFFVVPGEISISCGWIYVFTIVVYIIAMFFSCLTFKKTQKQIYLGTPVLLTVYCVVFVQTLFLFLTRLIPIMSGWIVVVSETLILGLFLIVFIALISSKSYIKDIDDQTRMKVNFIRQLTTDLTIILYKETNPEIKELLKQLISKIRYSDPVSDDSLSSLENSIELLVDSLASRQPSELPKVIDEIEMLLLERNEKCKLLK